MNLIILLLLLLFITNDVHGTDTTDCTNYDRKVSGKIGGYQKFVNCLGSNVESQRADLVVILDRSGSMSWYSSDDDVTMNGYKTAKAFIKSLLSEVKISFNATRISVITFANDHTADIDFLRNPKPANNKCEFDKLFKKPSQVWGATNIRGALNHAFNIFSEVQTFPVRHLRRQNVNRVALLLSDGEGNVFEGDGDPADASPEATKLKSDSIILYTVAVKGADFDSMKKWATNPKNVKDPPTAIDAHDFNNMRMLARNIRGGKYILFSLRKL